MHYDIAECSSEIKPNSWSLPKMRHKNKSYICIHYLSKFFLICLIFRLINNSIRNQTIVNNFCKYKLYFAIIYVLMCARHILIYWLEFVFIILSQSYLFISRLFKLEKNNFFLALILHRTRPCFRLKYIYSLNWWWNKF